jgi:hypothetical protein
MKITSLGDVFLGGLRTRRALEPVEHGCWIWEDVCLFGPRAHIPCHPLPGAPRFAEGNQGSPWDLAGLGYFRSLSCFYMVTFSIPFCLGIFSYL